MANEFSIGNLCIKCAKSRYESYYRSFTINKQNPVLNKCCAFQRERFSSLSTQANISETTLNKVEKSLSKGNVVIKTKTSSFDNSKTLKRQSIRLDPSQLVHQSIPQEDLLENGYTHKNPPRLAYGLDRILHHPINIHMLKDSRSGVYNYDKILESIAPEYLERKVEREDEPLFITPYKDQQLSKLAEINEKRFISSTSSMTSVLSQLHFFISGFRQLNIAGSLFSKKFPLENCNFSQSAYFAATVILRKKDTTNGKHLISVDSDRSMDREIILSILGHSLESFLTDSESKAYTDSYHYSIIDDFLLRSQLDAYDPTLPNYGTFDLKTRAACAIRHDIAYIEKNDNYTGYQMNRIQGEYESLEREFFELIRTTLLKYSLQARIGKMDGIFVAYHNISNIFGFQYLPLEEIDYILHSYHNNQFKSVIEDRKRKLISVYGLEDYILNHERKEREIASKVADVEFKLSMCTFRNILNLINEELPKRGYSHWKNCKVIMKAEPSSKVKSNTHLLNVIVLPLEDDYEDQPLRIKGLSDFDIKRELASIEHMTGEHLRRNADNIFGFKVSISHEYHLSRSSVLLPNFVSPSSQILPQKLKEFVKKQLYQDPYPSYLRTGRETPNFLHIDDVDTWQPKITIKLEEDKRYLITKYLQYSKEKIDALEAQSIVKETPDETDRDEIYTRIEKLWRSSGRKPLTTKSSKIGEDDKLASRFQHILRSYGKRGRNK
ncbi:Pet127p [Nakaseomyces bracarensis]|uniref:Pet127p n=1 Tax=Nakaseomyces bracarensis TaxID=273131 RepID=UPI0038715E55